MREKPSRRTIAPGVILLWGALACPSALGLYFFTGDSWVLIKAGILSLAGVAASLILILLLRRQQRRYRDINTSIATQAGENRDLSSLISTAYRTGLSDEIPAVADFLLSLNEDLTFLQKSSVKFDLFASDILFSSRNLAGQSESELSMLVVLRERSERSFAKLLETSRELEALTQGIEGYVDGATVLRDRVLSRYHPMPAVQSRAYTRKESRKLLLYNLEVHSEAGEPLGYLGDLSASGMRLLSEQDLTQGTRRKVRILFPLTTEGERSVVLSIEVRRVERDAEGVWAGCLFVDIDAAARRAIEELLGTLSLDVITDGGAGGRPLPPGGSEGPDELEEL